MRSITIDAENEEEFNREYDEIQKQRYSKLNFEDDKLKIPEELDEDNLCADKNENQGDYDGLGAFGDYGNDFDNSSENEKINEDDLIKNENREERGIELLCLYLKNSINAKSKDFKNIKESEKIFYKNKNYLTILSGNAISDFNFTEFFDNIMVENNDNDNDNNEDSLGVNNDKNELKNFICQNIESDATLKIMVMSNNKATKNLFINKITDIKEKETTDQPFEIKKKQIMLFNKYISLQIFDTSEVFHENNIIAKVYYQNSNAFFFLIDATIHNSKIYLDKMYKKIENFVTDKILVIFGVNMLFKEDCTIDGNNLREYADEKNIIFIPIKLDDFNFKNNLIINLLNLILIKRIDNKNNNINQHKESQEKKLGNIKDELTNKINCSSQSKKNCENQYSLGYDKNYRIRHIDAFDAENDNDKNKKRRWSVDI